MRRLGFFSGFLLAVASACTDQVAEHVVLVPAAEDVYVATEPPGADGYALVGQVTGQGQAVDVDAATETAKNDLRNKAASLGASLVTIDEDRGEPILLYGKTKVTLVGRAYKPVD
jgi:hypothetical protein